MGFAFSFRNDELPEIIPLGIDSSSFGSCEDVSFDVENCNRTFP